jgi:hypothetical protein
MEYNMSHYAKIKNGIVTEVIVADQEFINSGAVGDPTEWKQTSYNNKIRGSYAGIGYLYDEELDKFVSPKPFPSWKLDKQTASWKAPVEQPKGNKFYAWNENTLKWFETKNALPGEE